MLYDKSTDSGDLNAKLQQQMYNCIKCIPERKP